MRLRWLTCKWSQKCELKFWNKKGSARGRKHKSRCDRRVRNWNRWRRRRSRNKWNTIRRWKVILRETWPCSKSASQPMDMSREDYERRRGTYRTEWRTCLSRWEQRNKIDRSTWPKGRKMLRLWQIKLNCLNMSKKCVRRSLTCTRQKGISN